MFLRKKLGVRPGPPKFSRTHRVTLDWCLIPPSAAPSSLIMGDVSVMVQVVLMSFSFVTITAASSTHIFTSYFSSGAACYIMKRSFNNVRLTYMSFSTITKYIICEEALLWKVRTKSCFGRQSATLSNRVRVGFSEHSNTRWTLRSPCSSKPLASTPTRITPLRALGAAWVSSSFFSLKDLRHSVKQGVTYTFKWYQIKRYC